MFDIEIIEDKTQWVNLVKKIRGMTDEDGNMVEVGLFGDIGLVSIAKENELGDPPRRNRPWPIPERSFLRYVFDRDLEKNVKRMFRGAQEIIFNNVKSFDILEKIGETVSNEIKEFILSDYYFFTKPNHPITIRRKKHDHPLIEKGKIVKTLTYKVGRGNARGSLRTFFR